MDVAGYYQLKGESLESCGSCQYFVRVTKYPFFPDEKFKGKMSEDSGLSVCIVWADSERLAVPCTSKDMCELYTKKVNHDTQGNEVAQLGLFD